MKRKAAVVLAVVAAVAITSSLLAGGDEKKTAPRDVTLTGKIVDLHSYMTERFVSSDHVKCTENCIRAGVPAALETEDGLVIIGQGVTGAARTLAPLAFQQVELKGTLHERHGIRYIDLTSATVASPEEMEEPQWDEKDDEYGLEDEDEDEQASEDDDPWEP
jgi:hypothetical protein